MLHEFLTANRGEIAALCRTKIANRPAPRPTDVELEDGVEIFIDQIAETLRHELSPSEPTLGRSAAIHGGDLLNRGFTIAQVVHDYGNVCQAITEMAIDTSAPITAREFKVLNLCLDNAIAEAVTEYTGQREHQGTERLGYLAHELRNLLNRALLSFDVLKSGSVGVGGSTGAVLARSLVGLRNLIDRELAEVRLGLGVHQRENIIVRGFIEDLEIAATMEANARALQFSVEQVAADVFVSADRQVLESVVGNLLQNAFKFTRSKGHVWLRANATDDRVLIEVEDQCGGLPPGKADELFRPFEQRGRDRSGLGLGLTICERGAQANDGQIRVRNQPGVGCIFTLDLPRRKQMRASSIAR